jgi:tetratricopeptide (TPR) repeat protein
MLKTGRKNKADMKYFLILLILLVAKFSFSQQITYDQFKEKARTEINLRPEYGNVKKDQGYSEEDRKFIELVLKNDTTNRKGSEHLVRLGFQYLGSGDIETAMHRFNQAWLLDPKNENAYWGFGAIYGTFNDYSTAIIEYDKGLALNPQSSLILTDKATLYFVTYQQNHEQNKLDTAVSLLTKSYNINSENLNTLYKLSICYFLNKDCPNASKFYNKYLKLGGPLQQDGFADALKKLCNE